MCCGRKCNVAFFSPGTCAGNVFNAVFFCVFANTTTLNVLKFHDIVPFLTVNAIGIIDIAVGIGESNDFGSEIYEFVNGVLCHITRTAHANCLSFNVNASCLKHFEHEVNISVAGCFGANERTAEFETFTGESSCEFVGELLIHSEHVADFATANAYIACGNIGIGTNISPKFSHESLAETHDFRIALATRAEIATTFGTTHGKSGERVLECLLESKELQNAEVYRGVETDTAFVRTNGVVMLYAIAVVDLNFILVVNPCYAELVDTIGNAKTFNKVHLFELGVLIICFLNCGEHLRHSLNVFGLSRIAALQVFNYFA